ncbi:MAG: MarR family transcriptional regulator [Clostridiales bacterium]|nr:MarR family transcriptional regulator [Clostridiales bacterium]
MEREKERCCRPEPRTPDEWLNRRLHQCGHYLYHNAAGPRQMTVLNLLRENGPMSQRDIQEALGIQAGSVSELITKLESKGFLMRQKDDSDKRRVMISLTERGLSMELSPPEQMIARRYAVLEPEEKRQLTALLEKLLASWDEGGHER